MKRFIQKILNLAGLEVKRVDRTQFSSLTRSELPGEKHGGHIVEFVGLPGIGKTFLLQHCAKRLSDNFTSQSEFLDSHHPKNGLDLTEPGLIDLFRQLITLRVQGVLRDMEPTDNVRHQVQRILSLSAVLLRNMPVDATFPVNIFTDEGISKNFTEVLLALAQSGHSGAMTALSRRSLILVTADPTTAEAQLRDRLGKQRGKSPYKTITPLAGLTHDEKIQHYTVMQARYRDWIYALEPYTRGVLHVSREDDLEHNIAAVLEFVRVKTLL